MAQDLQFDLALSYCSEDSWAGKDIYDLVTRRGFSVYCYDRKPDHVGGFLRRKLSDIYKDSLVNLMVWSKHYRQKERGSLVAMERRVITNRHVNKGEDDSLMILTVDDTPRERDIEDILAHRLRDVGITGIVEHTTSRLRDSYTAYTGSSGFVRHPKGTEAARGRLRSCTFTIDPHYERDRFGRWEKYADVLVDFPNPLSTECVYLIPSGMANPLLRHTIILNQSPNLLEHKRHATQKYIAELEGKELSGFWFAMRVGKAEEAEVATVYSLDYDRFLNSSLQEL